MSPHPPRYTPCSWQKTQSGHQLPLFLRLAAEWNHRPELLSGLPPGYYRTPSVHFSSGLNQSGTHPCRMSGHFPGPSRPSGCCSDLMLLTGRFPDRPLLSDRFPGPMPQSGRFPGPVPLSDRFPGPMPPSGRFPGLMPLTGRFPDPLPPSGRFPGLSRLSGRYLTVPVFPVSPWKAFRLHSPVTGP